MLKNIKKEIDYNYFFHTFILSFRELDLKHSP